MAYIGQSIKNGTFTTLDTSGNTYNGSNTAFALGTQVGSPAQLLVSHDGVIQKPGTDYTLSSGGTAITFTTAPASGASIFIVEISGAVGGPLGSDINGSELILDADGDTSLHADTDDQIDIKIAGADDFQFTANTFTAQSGSTITTPTLGVIATKDLGIGIHVKESDSGAGVNANADHVVIEANGNAGMSILTATGSAGKIAFGDSGDSEIGKILYDHSNNSMQVYTNANQAMNISTAGQVTKPLQAYFHAVSASEQTNIANGATIVFGTEVIDTGGNFASNTFTAPVTGVYALDALINVNGYPANADYVWINIVTSNRTHKIFIQGNGLDNSSYYSLGGLAIADMDASDTAHITWEQSGASAEADVLASNTHFYGYLLG